MSNQLDPVDEVRRLFQDIFAVRNSQETGNSNPIFVSFDIAHGNKKGISAIGISVLDTRYLTRFTPQQINDHTHPLLWTHTYIFSYGSQGVRRAQKRALFDGNAQKVTLSNKIPLLEHIFSYYEEQDVQPCCHSHKFRSFRPNSVPQLPNAMAQRAAQRARPIILVGHAINQDLSSLYKIGFNVLQIARVYNVFDTQRIARALYWKQDPSRNVSLKELCILMGFRPINIHTSGNDAAYALIILLCLASRILGTETEESAYARDRLDEVVRLALGLARTEKGKWKAERREERQDVQDWADILEEMAL